MSSTYGHRITKIPESGSLLGFRTYARAVEKVRRGYGPNPDELVWRPYCSGRDCPEKPEYVTSYMYVTGRGGRVTDRCQCWCQAHGEAFANKHGLTLEVVS